MNLLETLKQARDALELRKAMSPITIEEMKSLSSLHAVIESIEKAEPVLWTDDKGYTRTKQTGEFNIPLYLHPAITVPEALEVHLCEMKESNGKTTWSVSLVRKGQSIFESHQVYSDSIKGRVMYKADELKHFLGLGTKPFILDYETDPTPSVPEEQWITELRHELMMSKMTHNFTFSRDEVIALLNAAPKGIPRPLSKNSKIPN